ncbi:MAG TPA: cyclase family protein [Chloroflexia bacterium]|nr:cyclase family protein [Chloroflexia bacterium]
MEIHDISNPVYSGMVKWPDNPPVVLERAMDMDQGATANVSQLACGVHTGTHVDAPVHFLPGGAGTDTLDLQVLIGPALVVYLADDVADITAAVLDGLAIPAGTQRLLFRTRNSTYWARGDRTFHEDFVAVRPDAATWLVEHGVRLVGVDYLSVAPYDAGVPTHRILLAAGVIPLEGLNLAGVAPGAYQLVCLPVKLQGCDGAPARAVLLR